MSVVYNHGIQDLNIPKMYWRKRDKKIVALKEVLQTPLANFRRTELWEQNDLAALENTSAEIDDLAMEMLEYCDGTLTYSQDDERLQDLVRSFFRPEHYCYHAKGRIGRAFLRKYRENIC